jgi:pyrroloquinoline-quinone synthase
VELLDRIDRMIDDRHLLTHPFYTKWAEGTLPREALQEYARQYYAFESAMPRMLSAIHSRTDSAAVRQHLLDNLWDEEHGRDNHAELWLRFAEGIPGAGRHVHRAVTHRHGRRGRRRSVRV